MILRLPRIAENVTRLSVRRKGPRLKAAGLAPVSAPHSNTGSWKMKHPLFKRLVFYMI